MRKWVAHTLFGREIVRTVLWLSTLAVVLSACSKSDEYEYVDDTQQAEGKVSVSVKDANGTGSSLSAGLKVGIYTTDADGNVVFGTSVVGKDGCIVLPASGEGRSLIAYLPYQESWNTQDLYSPQLFRCEADQSTEGGYEASDLMIGEQGEGGGIVFTHMLSQVVIHIVDETGVNDFRQCGVTLRDMNDAVTVDLSGKTVATVAGSVADVEMLPYVVTDHRLSLKAIVAPQQKEAGVKFITLTSNGYSRRYSIPQVADMQGGKTYLFNMRLTEVGLEFSGCSINDWGDEGEFSLEIK